MFVKKIASAIAYMIWTDNKDENAKYNNEYIFIITISNHFCKL